tara:strand:- start:354 stop:593 length:240 start_codon:yes stop_codon:yes gene_type:complete
MLRTLLTKLFTRSVAVEPESASPPGELVPEFPLLHDDPSSSESTFGFIEEDTWPGETHVYATDLKTFTIELDPEDDPCQ